MATRNEPKPEISAKVQAFKESSSKINSSQPLGVARGAGFEPARPVRTTGLAGLGSILPPTRLGQPRSSAIFKFVVLKKFLSIWKRFGDALTFLSTVITY
jgi:hypothetical protein